MNVIVIERSSKSKKAKLVLEDNTTFKLSETKLPNQYGFLKKMWKHPCLMHYHRLFVLAVLVNLVLLSNAISFEVNNFRVTYPISNIANFVLLNFSVAILIRQHYTINFLFWLATRIPVSWPLAIRRVLGKVYHFGGLHSGCAVAGTIWFVVLSFVISKDYYSQTPSISEATANITYGLLFLLVLIIVMAFPKIRSRFHNQFELSHRLGGWAALLLFWGQIISLINDQRGDMSMINSLLNSAGFWMLIVLTFSIALPWLRLKKVPVRITKGSSHAALVHFNYGVTPFAGSSTAVSRKPLFEWHSFANVPSPDEEGFRLTISRAGDWTGSFIDDQPSHLWVKGIPTAGVGNIDQLFKRVVWVATGSGIGPCLPHLLSKLVPSLLVWATRNPRKTYGNELVDEILSVQPDAVIWDTDAAGKPDMVRLAFQAYQLFDAEAVICISNKKLTWQVVYGMESRGIPAYGAIWDS